MSMIEGRFIDLLILIYAVVTTIYFMRAVQKGKVPKIRTIEAIEHIPEAIGRAVEMDSPVHFYAGSGGGTLIREGAPQLLSGMNVLSHVSKLTARQGAQLITTHTVPELVPISTAIIRDSYLSENKVEDIRTDMVRFTGGQLSTAAAVMGMMDREKPAANILIGDFWAESLIMLDSGAISGGIQIGGTATYHQIAFFVCACDYFLIGEEVYAAGAYLSGDPETLGSLQAQDVARIIIILMILGLVLFSTLNSNWFLNLLNL
jgi:hypothetical protein